MTVNYRSVMGFGFKLDIESALEALSAEGEYGPEYTELDDLEATVDSKYPLLELEFGGNMFTSEGHEQWVFIKDSIVKVYEWADTIDMAKILDSIDGAGMDQLFQFVADTGTAVGEAQWRMMLYCG